MTLMEEFKGFCKGEACYPGFVKENYFDADRDYCSEEEVESKFHILYQFCLDRAKEGLKLPKRAYMYVDIDPDCGDTSCVRIIYSDRVSPTPQIVAEVSEKVWHVHFETEEEFEKELESITSWIKKGILRILDKGTIQFQIVHPDGKPADANHSAIYQNEDFAKRILEKLQNEHPGVELEIRKVKVRVL